MSRLARKFVLWISAALIIIIGLSIAINNNFIERFYLYQKKQGIDAICQTLIDSTDDLDNAIVAAEEQNKAFIVKVQNTSDNDIMGGALREAFQMKGLGFERYWLWEEDYKTTMREGRQMRIYRQQKLNYSLLVEYVDFGEDFVAVCMIIPNVGETIALINWITVAVFGGAVLLIVFIIYILVKRITQPLKRIESAANRIAEQDFCRVDIHTGDELESLAESINTMSGSLELAQANLQDKNRQMESLLNSVTHDLKTPISLIKAYSAGMRDGMDDGSFLQTIEQQADRMHSMVEQLLDLSRIGHKADVADLDLCGCIQSIADEQAIEMKTRGCSLHMDLPDHAPIQSNLDDIHALLTNLITNAIKYTGDGKVKLELQSTSAGFNLRISNRLPAGPPPDIQYIWEPFYVADQSRNKEISGTGIGLSIVKAIVDKYGYGCEASIAGDTIIFEINFLG